MSKLQTQIRAELGWLWQQDETNTFLSDSGSVRFRDSRSDSETASVEGVWQQASQTLPVNTSASYELDYLNRTIFGTDVQLAFENIRALEIVNRSATGSLVVEPGDSTPWQAPWNQAAGQTVIPPGGVLLMSAGTAPWPVTVLSSTLKITAVDADGDFDIALVGKTDSRTTDSSAASETPAVSSSASSI